jgi:hypothetical protein
MPTIESIQRTAIILALFVAAFLLIEVSRACAIACIGGAVLMVANLSVLGWTVRAMAVLAHKAGGMNGLGLVAAPLKMLLLIAIAYFAIASARLNLPGFIAGTLTQFGAIFIEVGRASIGRKVSASSC